MYQENYLFWKNLYSYTIEITKHEITYNGGEEWNLKLPFTVQKNQFLWKHTAASERKR